MRSSLIPLAPNELFERALIVTRNWFGVKRNERGFVANEQDCLSAIRAALSVRTRSGSDGIEHSS